MPPSAIPSESAFDWPQLVATADRIAPAFDDLTRDWPLVDSSLLFSDGLCVCALCEVFAVDYLVESGTGFGGSTAMLAEYFKSGERVRHIWSVDMAASRFDEWLVSLRVRRRNRHLWSSTRNAQHIAGERLRAYPHVTLLNGDATTILPALVRKLVSEPARVGILLDGPKEQQQLALAEELLAISNRVRFAALDDIGPRYDAEGRHARFMQSRHAAFATSDPEYVRRYRWIDRGRMPDYMLSVPDHSGYGVGVLIQR